MTGDIPMVRLVLHDQDSVRVLRAALANYAHMNRATAVRDLDLSEAGPERRGPQKPEALVARAGVYNARALVTDRLLDQLPKE